MDTKEITKRYNLSRKAASKRLKVSTRTLDRYIKKKELSTQVISGRVWLDGEEVEAFKHGKLDSANVDSGDMSSSNMSSRQGVDNVDEIEVLSQEVVDSVTSHTRQRKDSGTNKVYEKLFNEVKEELNEKQERLEIANYRVGQLEAQLKSSVPMLEYHKERYEKEQKESKLRNTLEESKLVIKRLSTAVKYEKLNRRIFVAILLIVLALQPLWLIFSK